MCVRSTWDTKKKVTKKKLQTEWVGDATEHHTRTRRKKIKKKRKKRKKRKKKEPEADRLDSRRDGMSGSSSAGISNPN